MTKCILYVSMSALALTACKPTVKPDVSASSDNQNSGLSSIGVDYMDQSVRPQDDFFQFANGTWCKNNPVPNVESRWGSFNELDKRNKEILLELLKTSSMKNAATGSQDQILGDFFTSYTDMETRNSKGNEPLKIKLAALDLLKSRDDVSRTLAEQHKVGMRSLFGFGVGQDLKQVDRNTVYIGQGGLGLPNRDYYFKENKADIRTAYQSYIERMFLLLGNTPEASTAVAKMVYDFELRLAGSMMAPEESRLPEKTYNKKTYTEARQLFPSFDFENYLITLGAQAFDTIIVSQPEHLRNINDMMKEIPMENWIAYLKWKTINHYAPALSEEFVNTHFKFYGGVLSGKKEMKPITDRAIDEITGQPIGELLGKAFVERTYSQNAHKRVNEMVDNLLKAFQERINGLDWMSPETKAEALTKLNAIGRKLGYPEEWRDFSKLHIKKDDYLANLDNLAKFETAEELGKLYKPVNRKEWGMPAHMVNAYYHPLLNEIAFPAGIMQPPFFDENAEDAVNYGRIGMVIGHEFTHGFDDNGSKFAADGSFTNWWKESDRKLFEERTKTLGETYSNFCPLSDHCVNADLTMGENIADLGGLTMAFYAYKMTDEYKSGKLVNGYTPAQRFFIAYAQLWKINYTEQELKNRIATDSHSPGMYRVNGPLKNCPEFFEAFGIKEGDSMRNPSSKVAKIW
jgi:putative endopeptidase